MARFRNTVSGVVVDVDDLAAMRLPGTWEPVEGSRGGAAKKSTAKKRSSSQKKTESAPAEKPEPDEADDE